ncbi:MAG: hypothetical protein LBH84_08870 [Prevotellaceae bacterium]|nr:hypothetical protein [Prevotellaceae bacterium]
MSRIFYHTPAACFPKAIFALLLFSLLLASLPGFALPDSVVNFERGKVESGFQTWMIAQADNGWIYAANRKETGDITAVNAEIRPPWFRSTFARVACAVSAVALLVVLYKKTVGQKNRIIREKDQELLSQSCSHKVESSVKDREIYELHSKNLQAELDFKRQELTGYVLNLKSKNEMLLEVRKKAMSIADALDEHKENVAVKRKIRQLVAQIDANIENDRGFEVFRSNFNLIHQNFFKLLDDEFPQLSKSEKILCAYLKMNLSSKEIAPLQNISVRGVEVNRYRLRKKMKLSREVNLSDYLQNLGSKYEC